MKQFADRIKNIYGFYQKITKSFTFPYEINGHSCIVHAYIKNKIDFRKWDNIFFPSREQYKIEFIVTSKTMAPQGMVNVYIDESMLVNKKNYFYEDETMLTNLISFIKKTWDKENHSYCTEVREKPIKKDNFKTYHHTAEDVNHFLNNIVRGHILREHFLNNIVRGHILREHFLNNIVRGHILRDKGERQSILPDDMVKEIFSLSTTAYYLKGSNLSLIDVSDHEKKENLSYLEQVYHDIYKEDKQRVRDFYAHMDVDWEVLKAVTDNDSSFAPKHPSQNDSWKEKYVRYALGKTVKIVKNGEERIINPRREFFMNFSVIANVHAMVSDELLERIDNLRPIEGLVLQHKAYEDIKIKLTHSVLKYLRGQFYDCHGKYHNRAMIPIMIIAKEFPRTRWPNLEKPKDKNGRELFYRIKNGDFHDVELIDKINSVFHHFQYDYDSEMSLVFLNDINCSFKEYHEKLCRIMGDKKDKMAVSREIVDTIKLFIDKVVNPIIVYLSNKDDALASMIRGVNSNTKLMHSIFGEWGNGNLFKLYKMSKIVHDRGEYFSSAGNNPASLIDYDSFNEMDAAVKDVMNKIKEQVSSDEIRKKARIDNNVEWIGIINKSVVTSDSSGNKYYIIPLLSSDQLKEEGKGMSNCVGWGGYAERSFEGKSKIFSIRNSKFKRVATLEIGISGYDSFNCKQLYGYKNSEVSQEIEDQVSHFIDKLNAKKVTEDNSIPVEIENIILENRFSHNRERNKTYVSHIAGYGITEENIRAALIPWKPFLPKELYDAPLSKWRKIKYIREIIKLNFT